MTRLTMSARDGGFILSEANGHRSRQQVILRNSTGAVVALLAATVLGRITTGALSAEATAFAGNTGNGAMGAVTVDADAQTGTYKVVITEPGANVGNFLVERPDGSIDGQGDVAAAYNGSINFTLADGATDFVAGDGFDVVVSAADATHQDKYVRHNPAAIDGSQHVAGILFGAVSVEATSDAKGAAVVRDAEVVQAHLVWNGHTDDQQAAGIAALAELGIIARS